MPIRFRTEIHCGIPPGESISTCSEIRIPIRDWNITPNPVHIRYNGTYPSNQLLTITYPELSELDAYHDTDSWRFSIEVQYGDIEFFDVNTDQNPDNIIPDSNGKAYFNLQFKNLDQLPTGITEVVIKHRAYGTRDGIEAVQETRSQSVRLQNQLPEIAAPAFDKEMYNITYNRDTDTFIGDTLITLENVPEPLQILLHFVDAPGFYLNPDTTNNTSSIQRSDNISEIYTQNGQFNYGIALQAPQGGWYDVATIRVTVIGIPLNIQENITEESNFCLDNKYIEVARSSSEVDRLRMQLSMTFQIRGEEAVTIIETYEHLFLTDKLKLHPGDEIHDFFPDLRAENLQESIALSNIFDALVPKRLFKIAVVDITIQEYNSDWQLFETYTIEGTRWIPGKKPKAYPYLTNGNLRRTYQKSIIAVSATQNDYELHNLHRICSPGSDNSNFATRETDWIVSANFSRNTANRSHGALNIISHEGLRLEPSTNIATVIHCIFENQNLVPDWFSFTEYYEKESELEHVLNSNLSKGRKFKANVESTKTLRLNTGWIFKEELDVLEELIAGKLCYVDTPEHGFIKCIPISKKPLKYDSKRMQHQMMVEFEIIENER